MNRFLILSFLFFLLIVGNENSFAMVDVEPTFLATQSKQLFSKKASSLLDNKKSSTLGNGQYNRYLKVTFGMTSKELYQQEILAARQVCIRKMMQTHYSHSKTVVIDELTKILGGDILLEKEKKQIILFLEQIIIGVYQGRTIQFNCSNPSDCLG